MRLGKRERAALRLQKQAHAIVERERRERANAVTNDPYVPSFLGAYVDRKRSPLQTDQIAWEQRTMYFNGMPRKSKVREPVV